MQSAGGTITAAGLDMKVLGYTKVYDALTRTAGLPLTVGLLGRDTVFRSSQAFALKNVLGLNGSTLHVVAGYSVNDGNGGGNSAVALPAWADTIPAAGLSINAVGDTKVYDATTSSVGLPSTSGLQGSDTVTGLSQAFASKNVLGLNGSTLHEIAGSHVYTPVGACNHMPTLHSTTGTITAAGVYIKA